MEETVLSSQLKHTLLLLFAIFLLLPSIQATKVKYCDREGNYAVKVNDVAIIPDPVVSGQPATFNISAYTGQSISGGKLHIDVSFFSIHVHSENHDLCEEMSCPIAPGSFVLSHSQTLPGFTPPGSYMLKVTLKDGNDEELSCFSFNFKIRLGSSVSDS